MRKFSSSALAALAAASLLGLSACGGGRGSEPAIAQSSAGQVAPAQGAAQVSFYAASRFAEQATMGPTASLVAEIQAKGYARWLDDQAALPATQIDQAGAHIDGNPIPDPPYVYAREQGFRLLVSSPDQLRTRVAWSLSQFIVVGGGTPHPEGLIQWINLLQKQALGNYGSLLNQVTINPAMGEFLNNNQNRPRSSGCPQCAPNENYARELMQLFSIGVVKLNADGTPQRDSRGKYIETYQQTDVEQLARVLTGWENIYDPFDRLKRYAGPMVAATWSASRDAGQKTVLGKVFPAGQSAAKDLQDAVDLLMAHQNIGPFVALRLIQHHVKSNPTPAYVGRVAAVFRNNGAGMAGDLKAVIKAVLLDSEARAGDDPAYRGAQDGLIREPLLHRMAVLRALGCTEAPFHVRGINEFGVWGQMPWFADSVFSFYSPADRAPGSNLLAPEQKLLNAAELTDRLSIFANMRWNKVLQANDMLGYANAGCQTDALLKAFSTSPAAFSDYLSAAFFRGAMPPTLRANLAQVMREPSWDTSTPEAGALYMLGYALATPYFGTIQ